MTILGIPWRATDAVAVRSIAMFVIMALTPRNTSSWTCCDLFSEPFAVSSSSDWTTFNYRSHSTLFSLLLPENPLPSNPQHAPLSLPVIAEQYDSHSICCGELFFFVQMTRPVTFSTKQSYTVNLDAPP
jgi:hypothetical protein